MGAPRSFALDVLRQRVVFGRGSVQQVPKLVGDLGMSRVLVLASASATSAADGLAATLGDVVVGRLHEARQHVPEALAGEATRLASDSDADGAVTIGGGSATGLGKAVAVATGVRLVAVPTTYAGSEATPVYGITGTHKKTGRDERALPTAVVYDAELTTSMPAHVTATSGLNAMAHCVEAVYANGANPVTTLMAEEGVRLLARSLPAAVQEPHDVAAREDALFGAYLAGWSMATAGSALHHTLCHVIGGSYDLGHGDVHSVLLPHVAAYNAAAATEPLGRLAGILDASDLASGLLELAKTVGAPMSLVELGMPPDGLGDVVDRTVEAIGGRNPRPVDPTSLGEMLQRAYDGAPPAP
ncbi:MAG TPA: maleylacetate reductase [Nocardioidaceae bacterium]